MKKAEGEAQAEQSFIINFWNKIFGVLKWISPFELLNAICPTLVTWKFVDAWVVVNNFLALFSIWIPNVSDLSLWKLFFVIWGGVRVFEIFVYHVKSYLLFDHAIPPGPRYGYLSYRRSLLLSLHNYLEIALWYSLFYRCGIKFDDQFNILESSLGSFYYSIVTMTTLGYGDITPLGPGGWMLVVSQTMLGIFMALIVFARIISNLPMPPSIKEPAMINPTLTPEKAAMVENNRKDE